LEVPQFFGIEIAAALQINGEVAIFISPQVKIRSGTEVAASEGGCHPVFSHAEVDGREYDRDHGLELGVPEQAHVLQRHFFAGGRRAERQTGLASRLRALAARRVSGTGSPTRLPRSVSPKTVSARDGRARPEKIGEPPNLFLLASGVWIWHNSRV
jgi:hypothetical protein